MGAEPTTVRCSVCGEIADLAMTAECNWCDQRYHLNQRNDIEAKDCGAVWIDEQYLALQFACNTCLAKDGQAPAPLPEPARRSGARRRYRRRE